MSRPPKPAILTADEFTDIGRSLFGEYWQTSLARELGFTPRNVRYFADGTRPVHAGVVERLAEVCRERSANMKKIAATLERKAKASTKAG